MKKFWNIFLLTTAILAIGIFFMMSYLLSTKIETIKYNKEVDEIDLKLCDEDQIAQYYMVSTDYTGGRKAIKNKLLPLIQQKNISFGTNYGNISIRFVINCNGKIGLFRAKTINDNLETTEFKKSNIDYLKSLVSELDDWHVETKKEKKYDSYYYINFKIEGGSITDIF